MYFLGREELDLETLTVSLSAGGEGEVSKMRAPMWGTPAAGHCMQRNRVLKVRRG